MSLARASKERVAEICLCKESIARAAKKKRAQGLVLIKNISSHRLLTDKGYNINYRIQVAESTRELGVIPLMKNLIR